VTFLTFVNIGGVAALAGLGFSRAVNTATPKAGGGFELDVIAACFIAAPRPMDGVRAGGRAVDRRADHGRMNMAVDPRASGIELPARIKGVGLLLGAVFF